MLPYHAVAGKSPAPQPPVPSPAPAGPLTHRETRKHEIQARTVKSHDYSTAHQRAAAPESTASLPTDKGLLITAYRQEQHWHAGVQDQAPDRARPSLVEVLRPAQGDEVGLLGARHIHHLLAG